MKITAKSMKTSLIVWKLILVTCFIALSTINSAVAEPCNHTERKRHNELLLFRTTKPSAFVHSPKTRYRKLAPAEKKTHVVLSTASVSPISWNLIPRGGQQSTTEISGSPSDYGLDSDLIFDVTPFLKYNVAIGFFNLLGLTISLMFPRKQYHLDLLGTGAFALSAVFALFSATDMSAMMDLQRVQISSAAVIIWSVKLASFLFHRACKVKSDARLDSMLATTSGTITFWVISLVWGVVTSLPHSLGLTSSLSGNNIALITGALIFVFGFFMETIADFQKWIWKKQNPGKFCNVGVWSISQHPNFFGNILIWSGITTMNLPAIAEPLSTAGTLFSVNEGASVVAVISSVVSDCFAVIWSLRRCFVACLSPIFLVTLLGGQAKGTIGSSVEQSYVRYGNDPEFQEYVDSVPLIIPDVKKVLTNR
mmetsp:Transcript_10498/g.20271  ORF Transcript_10498/g.20271 Transcript_10498/m.20271 type:complete len:423 (+) Transcript_10498:106-1374(+)